MKKHEAGDVAVPKSILKPMDVQEVLDQRGGRYGSFADNASYSQSICEIIRYASLQRVKQERPPLKSYQREALEMIAHKMARILSGDADYEDNWVDIAGYAELGRNPR